MKFFNRSFINKVYSITKRLLLLLLLIFIFIFLNNINNKQILFRRKLIPLSYSTSLKLWKNLVLVK